MYTHIHIYFYYYLCKGICDDVGNGYFLECHSNVIDMIPCHPCSLSVHTNHYLGCGLGKTKTEYNDSSSIRFDTITQKIKEISTNPSETDLAVPTSTTKSDTKFCYTSKHSSKLVLSKKLLSRQKSDVMKTIAKLLHDRSHPRFPVLRPFELPPSGTWEETFTTSGTVSTVVMDLKKRKMFITRGSPLEHRFEELTLPNCPKKANGFLKVSKNCTFLFFAMIFKFLKKWMSSHFLFYKLRYLKILIYEIVLSCQVRFSSHAEV
ncbi:hypothetical protein RFI_30876 [Reticulomyxa filosa]|uniref:Uncharacterized protein n=1 Tax=Reticulomyxa filosa TaxID=46433 RepID=X6M0L3_RETFI|nr:hypothetical protein RFI_30876 [Reticulomyxa filosa]|eukprot:ETO06515.1 hypothetical protein RFI_30876 [Reticulomyxa filosa]